MQADIRTDDLTGMRTPVYDGKQQGLRPVLVETKRLASLMMNGKAWKILQREDWDVLRFSVSRDGRAETERCGLWTSVE